MIISDRTLVKELFATNSDLVARASSLGSVLGPGSTFSLDGAEHRERRKLPVPPFHGRRMAGYEAIVEEEVLRETAGWPQGLEFETLEPMMRITLNAILRTVFGAQGGALGELRELLPPMVRSHPGWRCCPKPYAAMSARAARGDASSGHVAGTTRSSPV